MSIDSNTIEAVGAIVTGLGGLYTGAKHLWIRYKLKKEAYKQAILDQAKLEAERIKEELESKILELKAEVEAQKENISRDIIHLREIYNAEIKVLAEKIEDLRTDLGAQHAQMVSLLTQLVNSK